MDPHFHSVGMAPGQAKLHACIRQRVFHQLVHSLSGGEGHSDSGEARRAVSLLLQVSANPILALVRVTGDGAFIAPEVVDEVLSEGPSLKMRAVADHARRLARERQKSVVWTIFTDTIMEMERMLADLNPVTLYGATPTGAASDPNTREGRLHRFHTDDACQLMIANPAAVGEGLSLQKVCHQGIFLDRSYIYTHYQQSIDRIHRLGLDPGVQTYIHIYQTKAPPGLGSIDLSVSRRLAQKLRNGQQLPKHPDLHQLVLDEEDADDQVHYDVDLQDLVDLVKELEANPKIKP